MNKLLHPDIRDLLLHSQRLLPSGKAAAIESHLSVCPQCHRRQETLLSTLQKTTEPLSEAESRQVWNSIQSGMKQEQQEKRPDPLRFSPARRDRNRSMRRTLAVAAALLPFLGLGLLFLQRAPRAIPQRLLAVRSWGSCRSNGYAWQVSPTGLGQVAVPLLLETDAGSGADIGINSRSGLRLRGKASLRLEAAYRRGHDGLLVLSCRLEQGLLIGRLNGEGRPVRWHIHTPHGSCQIVGTRFAVRVRKQDTWLAVFKGSVRMERGGDKLLVKGPGTAHANGNTLELRPYPKSGKFSHELKDWERVSRTVSFTNTIGHKPPALFSTSAQKKRKKSSILKERILLEDGTVVTGRIVGQQGGRVLIQTPHGRISVTKQQIRRIFYLE